MPQITLYPNAAGDITGLTSNSGSNWSAVDESSSDDDTTYVSNLDAGSGSDRYAIGSNTIRPSDTINSVTVYNNVRKTSTHATPLTYRFIKENSVVTQSASSSIGSTTYSLFSTTWATKPSNGSAWTKTDIDNLLIGVKFDGSGIGIGRCTQVYVVVDYTPQAADNAIMMAGD